MMIINIQIILTDLYTQNVAHNQFENHEFGCIISLLLFVFDHFILKVIILIGNYLNAIGAQYLINGWSSETRINKCGTKNKRITQF